MPSRPPPVAGPRVFARFRSAYSLRPVVIAFTIVGIIWTMTWSISAFQDLGLDKQNVPHLTAFDIVLGALYAAVAAIMFYGLFAAITQRLQLVRLFTFLSIIAAILVFAGEILRIVLHFVFKSGLISECVGLADGTIDAPSTLGFWGGGVDTDLTQSEAQQACNDSWSHGTFSIFAWFIASTIVSFLTCGVVFGYYHQLLDPTSVVSRYPRAPSNQFRMNAYPVPYNPAPYDPQYNRAYAPPSGPPPGTEYVPEYDPHKLPGYGASATDLQAEPRPEKE